MNASDSRPAHANTAERRTILDAIPVIAWCKLPDGSNEFVNQRWQDYTGIPADEARRQGWQAAVHPEDLPKLSEKWAEIVASGKSGEFEGRLRRHDGAFRWVLARFEPVRDDTSQIVRWYGTSTDIDALKQAEEKLREDERALRRITDTIPQNIVILDPDGIPIYANRATLDYTGLTLADVVSSDFRARVFHAPSERQPRSCTSSWLFPSLHVKRKGRGLVHETVSGKALDRAMEIAQRLSSHTPESVAYIKRLVRNATETLLAQGLALERNLFLRLCITDPALARMRSYEEENITSPSRSIVVGGGERES